MMREYAKCGKRGWVHVVITRDAAVDSAAGLDGHLHCQRCGASAAGFVPAAQADVPRLTLVRGIVLLSKLELDARAVATETVRAVAHNMLLSGKATGAESQRLLIEQETAEILEEKLLSMKERETLYNWTALKDGDAIKIAGLNADGFRVPAQPFTGQWKLLSDNAHPALPGYTAELCQLLSKKE